MTITEEIINTAKKYLNEKEIPDNRGWYNKALEKTFKLIGWKYGQHWCAYTMELVWKEAYAIVYPDNSTIQKLLTVLCSGNSQKTFYNFQKSILFETGNTPRLGAAVVWKHSGRSGHTAAAVVQIDDQHKVYYSIEGNAGNMISLRKHKYNEKNLLGFIYPKELLGFIYPKEF